MQIKSRIESRSNPKVIWARGLSERKNRQKEGLFRFEGIKLFSEALREKLDIVCVFATEKALALYKRLGFVQKPRPEYLAEDENIASVYMEKQK